jgi:hypothetical protein
MWYCVLNLMNTEPTLTVNKPELHHAFKAVKNSTELRAWLMRAYFSPVKHSDQSYFSDKVSAGNVLEYISGDQKKFPQTPDNIVSLWKILPGLRKSLSSMDDLDTKIAPPSVYASGETSLRKIAACTGGITVAMTNNIFNAATEKIAKLVQNLNSDNDWLIKYTSDRMEKAFFSSAEAYADAVLSSKTPEEVFAKLKDAKFLGKKDLEAVDAIEKAAVAELISWISEEDVVQSQIEDVLLKDIEKTHNVFLTYQAMVSSQVYKK